MKLWWMSFVLPNKTDQAIADTINSLNSRYKKVMAWITWVSVVALSWMWAVYINDNKLKIWLYPTWNIVSISSTVWVVNSTKASREIQIQSIPQHNEMILIESCQISFSEWAKTNDNSTFQDDLDCNKDNVATIWTYTSTNPWVQLTISQIADKLDLVSWIYSIEHWSIITTQWWSTSTVFRTSLDEKSWTDIYWREWAVSVSVLTNDLLWSNWWVASLDGVGKLPTSQLPWLAINSTYVVTDEASMLAIAAEEWDIAVRSDLNKSFVHLSGTGQTLNDWTLLKTPTDAVLSVNGEQWAVSLTTDNIWEGITNKYFTDTRVETNAQVAANTAFRNSHGSTDAVSFGSVTTANDIKAGGYVQFKMLANSVAADCDADAELSRMYFDTTQLRPYVCSKTNTGTYVWKPLDSDFDKDGIMEAKDVDDYNSTKWVCLKGYYWMENIWWINMWSWDSNGDGYDDILTSLRYCDTTSNSSTPYAGADWLIHWYAYSDMSGYINMDSVWSTSSIW